MMFFYWFLNFSNSKLSFVFVISWLYYIDLWIVFPQKKNSFKPWLHYAGGYPPPHRPVTSDSIGPPGFARFDTVIPSGGQCGWLRRGPPWAAARGWHPMTSEGGRRRWGPAPTPWRIGGWRKMAEAMRW